MFFRNTFGVNHFPRSFHLISLSFSEKKKSIINNRCTESVKRVKVHLATTLRNEKGLIIFTSRIIKSNYTTNYPVYDLIF